MNALRHVPRWYGLPMAAIVVAAALALVLRACAIVVTVAPHLDLEGAVRRHLVAMAHRGTP